MIINPVDSKIIGEVTLENIEESDLREAEKSIIILNKKIALKASEKIKTERTF